ncbi:MAG: efflux RND transporter periplasmic adaptor subunit [Planctomycetota bacterium]
MTAAQDLAIRELKTCKLALRGDLVWTPQTSADRSYYLVEDPFNGRFYRMGTAEYAFVSLLDGETTIGEALGLTATAVPDAAFTEYEAVTICNWLLENGLVRTSEPQEWSGQTGTAPAEQSPELQRWNPLVLRLPLLHPDWLFNAASPWVEWWFSLLALVPWLITGFIALFQIASDWNAVTNALTGVFAPLNWLWLSLCWFGLKVVHEFAHGAACKKFGGSVREAGFIFILFMPITYVDVSSSWKFRSKWHRVITAAAGMYAELFVASIATLLWSHTSPGLFNSLCFDVMIMASISTLVFNANFLMRFDGYYIFSDVMEIPNLAAVSRQQLKRVTLIPFFRAGPAPPGLPASRVKRFLVTCYGLASFLWKIVVCTGMIIAASAMFEGAGAILAVLAALLWLGVPLVRFVKRMFGLTRDESTTSRLSASTVGLAMIVAAFVAIQLPWPLPPRASAIVDYQPLTIIRADSPGFLKEIHVQPGQLVTKGELLAVLRNEELALELADLELSIQQLETRCRVHEHGRKMAAWQAEMEELDALRKKHIEKMEQVSRLILRAPTSGRVIGSNLRNLTGSYLQSGDQILSIGREQHKELRVAIEQQALPVFKSHVGRTIRVRLSGGRVFVATLSRIEPRARLECPHPALSGETGGPLAVKPKINDGDEADSGTEEVELLVPHFIGHVALDTERGKEIRAGQLAQVALAADREAIGSYVLQAVTRWTRRQFRRAAAHGRS